MIAKVEHCCPSTRISELLDGGRCGRLVPERDVDALADVMYSLASSSEECARLSRAGRERIENAFRIEMLVEKLQGLYDAALQAHSGGSGHF
jgi:glycosyltransferase involved in cell wall biosynthesis